MSPYALLLLRIRKVSKLQAEVKKERQQIIQLNIIIGGNEESSGDHFGALLRYTEALKLEDGDIESQRFLRGQIARELRRCPRLVGLLSLDRPIIAASVDPAKRLLAAVDGSNFVQICDAQNGLPYGWRMKHAD